MFHFFDTITNTKGDSLPGWFVECVLVSNGTTVIPIFSDESGTPISTVSGVTNRAKSDSRGNYDFFVNDGVYSLNFYNSDGVFQSAQRYLPMYGGGVAAVPTSVATRTALAAIVAPAAGDSRYLLEGRRAGMFKFDTSNNAANVTSDPGQGIYVAPASATTGASGAWVRQYSGPVDVTMFGAVANNTTDDSAAFVNAIAFLYARRNTGVFGYGAASGAVFVPAGVYYMGTTTLDLIHTVKIFGEGTGLTGAGASVLRWAAGATGIRVQAYNTSGASGTRTPAADNSTGSGSIIQGLFLRGGYAGAGFEAEEHGVHLRGMAKVADCYIRSFKGDGIYGYCSAGSGGATEGNCNLSRFEYLNIEDCRTGIFLRGADANAGTGLAISVINSRTHGICDNSFLGNFWYGCHADNNGVAGAQNSIATSVNYRGSRFSPKSGQETICQTVAPTCSTSTVTISIASPGVVTWNAHGLSDGQAILLTTTGALPSPLAQNVYYYVINSTANTFQLATVPGGGVYNTTGTQSGTHTASAGVDDANWWYLGPPGALGYGCSAWVSGMTLRLGGPYRAEQAANTAAFRDCYSEGGQPPSLIGGGAEMMGGTQGSFVRGGNYVGVYASLRTFYNSFETRAPTYFNNNSNFIGANSGLSLDNNLYIQTTLNNNTINFTSYNAAGNTNDGNVISYRGIGLYLDGRPNLILRYNGVDQVKLNSAGFLVVMAGIKTGYDAGTGGTVTQATSKSTGATLNKTNGQVVTNNAALAASTSVGFTLTNSTIAADDEVAVWIKSGATAASYFAVVDAVAAGSCRIHLRNVSAGSLSEAVVIGFAVRKTAIS